MGDIYEAAARYGWDEPCEHCGCVGRHSRYCRRQREIDHAVALEMIWWLEGDPTESRMPKKKRKGAKGAAKKRVPSVKKVKRTFGYGKKGGSAE